MEFAVLGEAAELRVESAIALTDEATVLATVEADLKPWSESSTVGSPRGR